MAGRQSGGRILSSLALLPVWILNERAKEVMGAAESSQGAAKR